MRAKDLIPILKDLCRTPYKLGSFRKADGLDCLSTTHYFYNSLGFKVPPLNDFGYGVNSENYKELYEKNREEALDLMFKIIRDWTEQVDVKRLKVCDLLLVRKGSDKFVAVYIGSGNLLVVHVRGGVFILTRRLLKTDWMEARRFAKQE